MEAAPRLAMLSLDLKESRTFPDFRTVFRRYIVTQYGEAPTTYDGEINELEALRNNAIKVSRDISGCNVLKRYFCQLKLLYPRFPMKENEACAVGFSWQDNFTGKAVEMKDPKFEEANILYNIGALHSLLGALDRRLDSETMKVACTHFQFAAWAFEQVRDKYPRMPTFDLSFDVLSFYITLMLAQAQECILEKSLLDNRKSSIIAKVCVQVVDYYRECLKMLDNEATMRMPGMDSFKDFIPRQLLELKTAYYQAVTCFQMGCQAEEAQKWGERISYLESAAKELSSCSKLIKNCGDDDNCREAVQFVSDIIQQKLISAKKDNDFIYHEKVPDINVLPAAKGVSLVKGIPLNESESAGQDIFARLVPFVVHERASMYSEKKAALLRDLSDRVETKDVELLSLVSALRLEQLCVPSSTGTLPQHLLDAMAALRNEDIKTRIAQQEETLNEVTDEIKKINDETGTCLETLKTVKLEKNQASVLEQLGSEYSRFSGAFSAAVTSNNDLQHLMDVYKDTLFLLSGPAETVKRSLPSVESEQAAPTEVSNIAELARLMGKVEEMRSQRQELLAELRLSIQNDDITKKVLAASDEDLDNMFQKELDKHGSLLDLLEQNMSAQENIIGALTAVVEKLADLRARLVTTDMRRDEVMMKYESAYKAYTTFEDKVTEGVDFYRSLRENIAKIKQKAEELLKQVPVAPVKPKVVLPPSPITHTSLPPAVAQPAGPTLRDYLNGRRNIPNDLPIEPIHSETSGRLTLRDYLDARKSQSNPSPGSPFIQSNFQVPVNPHNPSWPGGPAQSAQNYSATDQQYNNRTNMSPNFSPVYHTSYAAPVTVPLRPPAIRKPPPPAEHQPALFTAGQAQVPHGYSSPRPQIGDYRPQQAQGTSLYAGNNAHPYHSFPAAQQNPQHFQATPMQGQASGSPSNYPYGSSSSYVQPVHNEQVSVASDDQVWTQQPGPNLRSQPDYVDVHGYPHQQYSAGQNFHQPSPNSTAESNVWSQQSQTLTSSGSSGNFFGQLPHSLSTALNFASSGQHQEYYDCKSIPVANSSQTFHQPTGSQQPQNSLMYSQPQNYSANSNNNQSTHNFTESYVAPSGHGSAGYIPSPQNSVRENSSVIAGAYTQPLITAPVPRVFPEPYLPPASAVSGYPQTSMASVSPQFAANPLSPLRPVQISLVPSQESKAVRTFPPKAVVSPLDEPSGNLSSPVMTPLRQLSLTNDDLLSMLPSSSEDVPILQPEKLTIEDIKRMKAQEEHPPLKEPLTDPSVLEKFERNFRSFEEYAEKLINQPDKLDYAWKGLQDIQERDAKKYPIAIARCYPKKNRDPRILCYDASRVILQSTKDDYINASHIEGLNAHCPRLVATQTPLPNTCQDFWSMVLEQGVEVIGALLTDYEVKGHCYWPSQRQAPVNFGPITVSLQKEPTETQDCVTLLLTVSHAVTKVARSVVHLRYIGWPVSGVPSIPFSFANFTKELCSYQRKQRVLTKPLLVHCQNLIEVFTKTRLLHAEKNVFVQSITAEQDPESPMFAAKVSSTEQLFQKKNEKGHERLGVGATGVLCATIAFQTTVDFAGDCCDLKEVISRLRNCRKFMVENKEQLRFLYQVALVLGRRALHEHGLLPDYTETVQKHAATRASKTPSRITPIPDVLSDIRLELQQRSVTPPITEKSISMPARTAELGKESPTIQIPPLANLNLDDLSLDLTSSKHEKKRRITKESFANQTAGVPHRGAEETGDPFADLDPFRSLKG